MNLKFVCLIFCLILLIGCVTETEVTEVDLIDESLINDFDEDLIDLNKSSFELIENAFISGEISKEDYFIQTIYSVYEPELLDEQFKGTEFVVDESFMNSFLNELSFNFYFLSLEAQEILLPFILPSYMPESYWYEEDYDEIIIEVQKKEKELILFSDNDVTGVRLRFPKNYSEEKRKIVIDSIKKAHEKYYDELNLNRLKGEITINFKEFTGKKKQQRGFARPYNKPFERIQLDLSVIKSKLLKQEFDDLTFFNNCEIFIKKDLEINSVPRTIVHELFHCMQFAQPIYLMIGINSINFFNRIQNRKTNIFHPFILEPCAYYSEELVLGTRTHLYLHEFGLVEREKELCEMHGFHFSFEKINELINKNFDNMPPYSSHSKNNQPVYDWAEHIHKFRDFFPLKENEIESINLNQLRQLYPWPKKLFLLVVPEEKKPATLTVSYELIQNSLRLSTFSLNKINLNERKIQLNEKKVFLVVPELSSSLIKNLNLGFISPKIKLENEIPGVSFELNSLNVVGNQPHELKIIVDYETLLKEFGDEKSILIEEKIIVDYDLFLEEKPEIDFKLLINNVGCCTIQTVDGFFCNESTLNACNELKGIFYSNKLCSEINACNEPEGCCIKEFVHGFECINSVPSFCIEHGGTWNELSCGFVFECHKTGCEGGAPDGYCNKEIGETYLNCPDDCCICGDGICYDQYPCNQGFRKVLRKIEEGYNYTIYRWVKVPSNEIPCSETDSIFCFCEEDCGPFIELNEEKEEEIDEIECTYFTVNEDCREPQCINNVMHYAECINNECVFREFECKGEIEWRLFPPQCVDMGKCNPLFEERGFLSMHIYHPCGKPVHDAYCEHLVCIDDSDCVQECKEDKKIYSFCNKRNFDDEKGYCVSREIKCDFGCDYFTSGENFEYAYCLPNPEFEPCVLGQSCFPKCVNESCVNQRCMPFGNEYYCVTREPLVCGSNQKNIIGISVKDKPYCEELKTFFDESYIISNCYCKD